MMGFGTYTNLSAFLSAALPTIAVYGNHVSAKSTGALLKAIEYIETNYATITSVHEIATAAFPSESRLYHIFKENLDLSPISYLNYVCVHAAIELLSNPDLSIQQITDQLNFHSEYYFRKTFQKITGMLPSKMRKML